MFMLQFRRCLSNNVYEVWRCITNWENCRYLPRAVCQELFSAICLSPALITDLRTRPDLLITSSDASATGAGIAATAGLTEYGVWSALTLPQELPLHQERGCVLISLFGGIEAGRRACDLLGVALIRHAAVKIDSEAMRAAFGCAVEATGKTCQWKTVHQSRIQETWIC